jgi:hypothetical protein
MSIKMLHDQCPDRYVLLVKMQYQYYAYDNFKDILPVILLNILAVILIKILYNIITGFYMYHDFFKDITSDLTKHIIQKN